MALLNARPSRSRSKRPALAKALLSPMALITAQDHATEVSLTSLYLRVAAVGDLKAAAAPLPHDPAALEALRNAIGGRPVWIAASTHVQDEPHVAAALREVRRVVPDALLIHAPRHPARLPEVLARWQDVPHAVRSKGDAITPETQVYVADTLGELGLFFRLSPAVFLGGSFGTEGGHNLHEPAALGAVVLHGPHVRHQARAYAHMDLDGSAVEVADGQALGAAVLRILEHPPAGQSPARTDIRPRTVALLANLLKR